MLFPVVPRKIISFSLFIFHSNSRSGSTLNKRTKTTKNTVIIFHTAVKTSLTKATNLLRYIPIRSFISKIIFKIATGNSISLQVLTQSFERWEQMHIYRCTDGTVVKNTPNILVCFVHSFDIKKNIYI